MFRNCCGCKSKTINKSTSVSDLNTCDNEAIPNKVSTPKKSVDFTSLDLRKRLASKTSMELQEELAAVEKELAQTNIDVKPALGRRKSNGILKSTSSYTDVDKRSSLTPSQKYESFAEDDDEVFCEDGPQQPPATPVGRDELALRRHRFFSDLVTAARAAVEHRVRFDPLGPHVADTTVSDPGNLVSALHSSAAAEFESLIARLEKVTSRLENVCSTTEEFISETEQLSTEQLGVAEYDVAIQSDNMSVNGFQDLIQGPLQSYLHLSQQIGGDVAKQAELVNAAFQAQFQYIQLAASRSKPSQNEEMAYLTPTSQQISAIQQFREKNRTSPFFNHLSAISESIPALGWVTISPAPSPYVKEMNDAGQFYTNRVLKDWKEKNKKHVEWCKAWVQLLQDLQAFVKQHHTTGLVWAGKGAGGPPPPPPGGLPPPPMPTVDFSNMSVDDRSALFAEINKGENITSHLRKVTSDMQTHKNPNLRSTGVAPAKTGAPGKALPTPGAGAVDKPPVFARDGKKWLIEYQKGNHNLLVENPEMNNVVYMYRCRDSALTIKGKLNGIVMDSCTKCAVVFDNLVSGIEFVNCQSVQMQVLGKVSTITVDKTDGCQMYLSPQSLDVEVVSSKSSEMNVLLPQGNGDYTEHPVPEQFKTTISKGGLSTVAVENKG